MPYQSDGAKEDLREHRKKELRSYLRAHPDATRLQVELAGMTTAINLYGGLQGAKEDARVDKKYNLRAGEKRKADLAKVERNLRARMRRNRYVCADELSQDECRVTKKYGGMEAFRKKVLGFSKLPRRDNIHNNLKRGR